MDRAALFAVTRALGVVLISAFALSVIVFVQGALGY